MRVEDYMPGIPKMIPQTAKIMLTYRFFDFFPPTFRTHFCQNPPIFSSNDKIYSQHRCVHKFNFDARVNSFFRPLFIFAESEEAPKQEAHLWKIVKRNVMLRQKFPSAFFMMGWTKIFAKLFREFVSHISQTFYWWNVKIMSAEHKAPSKKSLIVESIFGLISMPLNVSGFAIKLL